METTTEITAELRQQLRREWIAALRSGEYRQCRYTMDDLGAHCVLGVAEQILIKRKFASGRPYDDVHDFLGLSYPGEHKLMRLNDRDRKTLPEIADFIEQHPEAVFVD